MTKYHNRTITLYTLYSFFYCCCKCAECWLQNCNGIVFLSGVLEVTSGAGKKYSRQSWEVAKKIIQNNEVEYHCQISFCDFGNTCDKSLRQLTTHDITQLCIFKTYYNTLPWQSTKIPRYILLKYIQIHSF